MDKSLGAFCQVAPASLQQHPVTILNYTRTRLLPQLKRLRFVCPQRAVAADLPPPPCCHTFRATGITAHLRSYAAAYRTVMPSVVHVTDQYANNRAEVSHQRSVSGSARCGASRRPPTCTGSRRYTELCRISFESGDIYSGRATTACSEGGRSSNGMRRRVRAERARANYLEAEQRTVHTKLTVQVPIMSRCSRRTVGQRTCGFWRSTKS